MEDKLDVIENEPTVIEPESNGAETEIPALSRDIIMRKRYKRLFIAFLMTTILFGSALFYVVYTNYSYIAFKFLVADHYAFPETLETLFRETVGIENPRNFRRNFDEVVIHVFIERLREIDGDVHTFLYTPQRFEAMEERTAAVARETRQEEIAPDTNFLRIPNFYHITQQYIRDNRHAINEFDSIIIDLRNNGGGALRDFHGIAGLFLERNAIIGFENTRTPFFSNTITSRGDKFFEFDQIIILQNGRTASAAEGFIMALKENLDNVTTVGTQTFGKGIGQIAFPLRRGFVANVTVLTMGTPSGGSIHKTGITPDIFYDGDDIISFALGLINEG